MKKISFLVGFLSFFLAQHIQELITGEYELPGWFFVEGYANSEMLQLILYLAIYNLFGLIFILSYRAITKKQAGLKSLALNLLLFNIGIVANVLILLIRLSNAQWTF